MLKCSILFSLILLKRRKKNQKFWLSAHYTLYNRRMTMPLSFRIYANYLIFFAVIFSFFRLTSSKRSTIFRMKYFNECARIQLPCSQSMDNVGAYNTSLQVFIPLYFRETPTVIGKRSYNDFRCWKNKPLKIDYYRKYYRFARRLEDFNSICNKVARHGEMGVVNSIFGNLISA